MKAELKYKIESLKEDLYKERRKNKNSIKVFKIIYELKTLTNSKEVAENWAEYSKNTGSFSNTGTNN
jgi:hypothetical protein